MMDRRTSVSDRLFSRKLSKIDIAVVSSLALVLAGVKAMIFLKIMGGP